MKMWKLNNDDNNNEDRQRTNFISINLNPNHPRMYFRYFVVISLWKGAWTFICTNLNPDHPRMLCAKFGWNWPNGSKKMIFKFLQCIFAISLLSPLWKGCDPSFEQTWIPFTQGSFMLSLVKIGPVVLKMKIFIFCQCFSLFPYYLPFKMGLALHLNHLNSLHSRMLWAKFG